MHRRGGTVYLLFGGDPNSHPPNISWFRPWLRLWLNLWHGQVLTIHTTQKFRRADSGGLEMDEFRSIVFGGRVTPGVFESIIITGFKVVSFCHGSRWIFFLPLVSHRCIFYFPYPFSQSLILLSLFMVSRDCDCSLLHLFNTWRNRGCMFFFHLSDWVACDSEIHDFKAAFWVGLCFYYVPHWFP